MADKILSDLHSLQLSSNECNRSFEHQHEGEDTIPEEGLEDRKQGRDGLDEGSIAFAKVVVKSNKEEESGA